MGMVVNPSRFGAGAPTDPYWSSVVALWPFNESAGATTFLEVKNGYTTTVTGDPVASSAQAKFGSTSIRMNAPNDGPANHYIYTASGLSDFTLSGDFTLETWVYFYAQSRTNMGVFSKFGSDTVTGGFQLGRSSSTGKMYCSLRDASSVTVAGATATSANTWYHVAVDRSGSTFWLYVNGNVEGSGTQAVSLLGGQAEIGRGHTAADQCSWNGHMQDLRLTKGVARYAGSGFTPPTDFYPHG